MLGKGGEINASGYSDKRISVRPCGIVEKGLAEE